ncbi:hypothetical protein Q7P37_007132 [Cladosporium fusiforme]
MKRKEAPSSDGSPAKKAKPQVPAYHETPTVKEVDGSIQWPAPKDQMEKAREIILECARSNKKTLIVPDKDADGLSSGAILRHALILLGLNEDLIAVHLLAKGNTVHSATERAQMDAHEPSYVFVLDQGSRSSPPIVSNSTTTTLIIDHHHATSTDFPESSFHVTACTSPPVATSSLLTYLLCQPLHASIPSQTAWLAIVGTHGDLGTTLKWLPPFPDMSAPLKQHTKKTLNAVVSLINAPRRTASFDVLSAWTALSTTSEPASILTNPRLLAARAEINAEVERCTHAAPQFSADGSVAVLRIRSEAQVHPVIATRWAGHLNSKALEFVLVANEGYLPGKVNFSCRVARCARGRGAEVDIIASLRQYASLTLDADAEGGGETEEKKPPVPLLQRVGDDFARGHVQASGGIVDVHDFEELMRLMRVGEKGSARNEDGGSKSGSSANGKSPGKKKAGIDPGQKNTLTGYFGKAAKES